MKSYRIWLKSGGYIEGDIEDDEAKALKTAFQFQGKHEFKDTDGLMLIDSSQIVALAIVDKVIDKAVGFNIQ